MRYQKISRLLVLNSNFDQTINEHNFAQLGAFLGRHQEDVTSDVSQVNFQEWILSSKLTNFAPLDSYADFGAKIQIFYKIILIFPSKKKNLKLNFGEKIQFFFWVNLPFENQCTWRFVICEPISMFCHICRTSRHVENVFEVRSIVGRPIRSRGQKWGHVLHMNMSGKLFKNP